MGLPRLRAPDRVCLTAPATAVGRRGAVTGAHLHYGVLPATDRYRADRIRITSPARTVVDVAREHGVDHALVAADAALRAELVTAAALTSTLEQCSGWPGSRAAIRAIALADARSESPLESLSRLRIDDAGLPAGVPQAQIRDRGGRFIGRVDLYWDEFGVVGEADGLAKFDHPAALREEKIRQGRLEDCGLIVVRWGWAELADFAPVAARLRSAFARGARADRAPRTWIRR